MYRAIASSLPAEVVERLTNETRDFRNLDLTEQTQSYLMLQIFATEIQGQTLNDLHAAVRSEGYPFVLGQVIEVLKRDHDQPSKNVGFIGAPHAARPQPGPLADFVASSAGLRDSAESATSRITHESDEPSAMTTSSGNDMQVERASGNGKRPFAAERCSRLKGFAAFNTYMNVLIAHFREIFQEFESSKL
ncbi:hypothetical protein CYMTET_19888 [Cymbomonas tetramitiformis]|uniref:Uncharacterized protein n=1 Tax=Cymbomonas tetramitiformis TaxID=36881 RepID=A0AAE0G559_9CHLO|nr:hypothetical protein CYMTET_19888 [Cymbomonas tetramitiformis]